MVVISEFLNDTSTKGSRKHGLCFKAEVMLDALKERKKLIEIRQYYGFHPTRFATWEKEFLDGAEQVFGKGPV